MELKSVAHPVITIKCHKCLDFTLDFTLMDYDRYIVHNSRDNDRNCCNMYVS